MKILQVNVVYGHGSTGRIVETLHQQYLALGHDSYVLYGRGKRVGDPQVKRVGFLWEAKLWRFIQLFTGNLLGGSPLSTWNLKRHIKKIHPDVVHVHLINGNMCNVFSLVRWLKKNHYHVVFTHHAKVLFAGGCGINLCQRYTEGCGNCLLKKHEFGPYAPDRSASIHRRLGTLWAEPNWAKHTFVSPWLMGEANKSPIFKREKGHVVYNPVNTDVFKPLENETPLIEGDYVFFPSSMAGALTKGSGYINEIAEKIKPLDLKLVHTEGRLDPNAPENVIDFGRVVSPKDMANLYRHARATLLLSQFETFSMPTIESILCGTPVIGFEAGGPSSIETGGMAKFVPYGDVDALVKALPSVIKCEPLIQRTYSLKAIAEQYLGLYKTEK